MTNDLNKALFEFSKSIKKVKKGSNNPFFKSKYADLETILDSINDELEAQGLLVRHSFVVNDGGQILVTSITHVESNQEITSHYAINPVKNDPQAVGSAITYARRYCISAMLGLVQSDDDGEAAMGRTEKKSKKEVIKEAAENSEDVDWYEVASGIEDKLDACETEKELRDVWKQVSSRVSFIEAQDKSLFQAVMDCKEAAKERVN